MIAADLFAMSANAADANMQIMMAGYSCPKLYVVGHMLMQYKKTKDYTFLRRLNSSGSMYYNRLPR